ncbi:hypothetical protein MSG28_014622 [Choristoneura fumiferana]|uniref:Uncharacterized protein n=1 Tax=Choristoneura fumiferana TaxID=7141 RepID=A0ACC0JSP9_CHOFU|nr:hypothetical protein MSG28_014622 [Choristoneura fumiferana]
MDMRLIRAIVVLIACTVCSQVASQPVEAAKNVTSDASECFTARSIPGQCVHRQRCDHGTAAIDQTLYAPHGYVRPCAMDEVCCPEFALAHVEMFTMPSMDSDEDDN